MDWAINEGGWNAQRFNAIDANEKNQLLLPIPNLLKTGTPLPGLYRKEEANSNRASSRAELACLASWKRLILNANKYIQIIGFHIRGKI